MQELEALVRKGSEQKGKLDCSWDENIWGDVHP